MYLNSCEYKSLRSDTAGWNSAPVGSCEIFLMWKRGQSAERGLDSLEEAMRWDFVSLLERLMALELNLSRDNGANNEGLLGQFPPIFIMKSEFCCLCIKLAA